MDHIENMYGYDDEQDGPADPGANSVRRTGALTEVMIGKERLMVVDPAVVQNLERTMLEMQKRLRILEQDVRTLTSNLRRSEMQLRETKAELDRKISYE